MGRSACPTSVKKWKIAGSSSKFYGMSYQKAEISIECGSEWSEWSGTAEKCGDRIQSRKRVDRYGLTTQESRNIG